MRKQWTIGIAAVVIGSWMLAPAYAIWPFDSDKKASSDEPAHKLPATEKSGTRRYHLHIPDKDTEKELLDLFRAQRMESESVRVLNRLDQDRRSRLASLESLLGKEFGIDPKVQYEFEQSEQTIYRMAMTPPSTNAVVKSAAVASGTNAAPVVAAAKTDTTRKRAGVHRKLKDQKEVQRFLDLSMAKRRTIQEIQTLGMVFKEEQTKLEKVSNLLSTKFAMKPGKYYDYDRQTMRLYEVDLPQAQTPAAGGRPATTAGRGVGNVDRTDE